LDGFVGGAVVVVVGSTVDDGDCFVSVGGVVSPPVDGLVGVEDGGWCPGGAGQHHSQAHVGGRKST
jgi:hypothetical protein